MKSSDFGTKCEEKDKMTNARGTGGKGGGGVVGRFFGKFIDFL